MRSRGLAAAALAGFILLGAPDQALAQEAPVTEAMLPSEGQVSGLGMVYLSPPSANLNEAGAVASVAATYKAPPAPGEPLAPLPICEGAGPGGADAGYGPNLCIAVTISRPSEPCADCFDLAQVRQRFPQYPGTTSESPAPDPCQFLSTDAPEWPCVEATGAFDRGALVLGYDFSFNNEHTHRVRLIGEVGGVNVSMSSRYLTYALDPADLDYMKDQMLALAPVVAAQIRAELARTDGGDGGAVGGSGDGGSQTATGGFPTTNNQPVDYIAPVAVIGAIGALAAVAATIGAAAMTGATGAMGAAGGVAAADPSGGGGPALVDPDTGQVLPTDGGKVWWGEWMDHDQAQQLIDARTDEIGLDKSAAAQHAQFVAEQQAIRDDRLKQQGFIFDQDSGTWKPGEQTQAILDKQWQDLIAQDPSWQETQAQFTAIQEQLDEEKKHMLESHNWSLQQEHDINAEYAKVYDKMTWAAQGVQALADTSINILEKVTGPAGGVVKKGYTFLKTFGGELSKGGVTPENLLLATLKGATDVGMDELGGKIGFDFGDGPDLSEVAVKDIVSGLLTKDLTIRKQVLMQFVPGLKNAGQGEALNWAGWRPMTDDAKTGIGALVGDQGDMDSLLSNPTFLEHLIKQRLTQQQPNVLGGTP